MKTYLLKSDRDDVASMLSGTPASDPNPIRITRTPAEAPALTPALTPADYKKMTPAEFGAALLDRLRNKVRLTTFEVRTGVIRASVDPLDPYKRVRLSSSFCSVYDEQKNFHGSGHMYAHLTDVEAVALMSDLLSAIDSPTWNILLRGNSRKLRIIEALRATIPGDVDSYVEAMDEHYQNNE